MNTKKVLICLWPVGLLAANIFFLTAVLLGWSFDNLILIVKRYTEMWIACITGPLTPRPGVHPLLRSQDPRFINPVLIYLIVIHAALLRSLYRWFKTPNMRT